MKTQFHFKLNILVIFLFLFFSSSLLLSARVFAISIEEERKLGQKFLAQIREHFELIEDDFANQYITDLGHYLIRPLETKPFPFHFYIIKSKHQNAFAAPGGHIFVFSGLVEGMESLDELAAVICHEIGHVSARHLSQRIEQSQKIGLATMAGILAGALIGGELAQAVAAGSMAAGVQAQLHYSRQDERQADQLGFEYMKSAGINPLGMITTLKKLEKGRLWGTDRIPPYLLTHPTGPERMSNLDAMLSHFKPEPPKREVLRFRSDFQLFRTILRAKSLESKDAERLFQRDLEDDPSSLLPHLGLGIVYKERSEYELAIRHLRTALKAAPSSVVILRELGETYQLKGQNREAISILEEALELDAENRSTLFLLAISYENLERYGRAVELFEKLSYFRPVNKDVYYHLGISYGRLNKLSLAHYNFGLYFKRLRETEKAKFHFQKADQLSASDPVLRRKIHEASKSL